LTYRWQLTAIYMPGINLVQQPTAPTASGLRVCTCIYDYFITNWIKYNIPCI